MDSVTRQFCKDQMIYMQANPGNTHLDIRALHHVANGDFYNANAVNVVDRGMWTEQGCHLTACMNVILGQQVASIDLQFVQGIASRHGQWFTAVGNNGGVEPGLMGNLDVNNRAQRRYDIISQSDAGPIRYFRVGRIDAKNYCRIANYNWNNFVNNALSQQQCNSGTNGWVNQFANVGGPLEKTLFPHGTTVNDLRALAEALWTRCTALHALGNPANPLHQGGVQGAESVDDDGIRWECVAYAPLGGVNRKFKAYLVAGGFSDTHSFYPEWNGGNHATTLAIPAVPGAAVVEVVVNGVAQNPFALGCTRAADQLLLGCQ